MERAEMAASFRVGGEDYDRYRPGFPAGALDVLLSEAAAAPRLQALDLGAGTGKFTDLLVQRGFDVTAVEPSESMLGVLAARLPSVRSIVGPAEAIPVPEGSQDLVTVAQAFHWFDRDTACAEIVRVLRPGGALGLIWNTPDPACAWDVDVHEVLHPGLRSTVEERPPQEDLPGLVAAGAHAIRWEEAITREDYLRRALTISSLLMASPPERERMLARIGAILDAHPDTAGHERLPLSHVTVVHRYGTTVGVG